MAIEEAFGAVFGDSIFDVPSEPFRTPREMADKLERVLSNERPNKKAAALLIMLARKQGHPEIAEGLEGTWRREQIVAIVRNIFPDEDIE